MNICLQPMTIKLAKHFYQHYIADEDLLLDGQPFKPYVYNEAVIETRFDRYQKLGHQYLAVMLNNEPVGEIILKNIDHQQKQCTLSISMRSNEFKNRGYGTAAEILVLKFAFEELGMETILADTVLRNTRSQHVLQKVGFQETHRDASFIYYQCCKDAWAAPDANR